MKRPQPAVGQVWKTRSGKRYHIFCEVPGTEWSRASFEDGSQGDGCMHPGECVKATDTYVGQFDGFKVKETM